MKMFLIKIVLFFALVVGIDIACGCAFDWLRNKARGGQTWKNQYISEQCVDDILILGSSKASHHYVPSIISDSLGMSCFNCGKEGNGIIAAYARYNMIAARHKPKIVIYEVTPKYDYLEDNGYTSYLGAIRQYTNNETIRSEILAFSDDLESIRLMSNMYCNNSRLISNLKDIVKHNSQSSCGYEPLYGKMTRMAPSKKKSSDVKNHPMTIDLLKYDYLEELVKICVDDGVKFVFIISPSFEISDDDDNYIPAFNMSERYGVHFIDNKNCRTIAGNTELFQDKSHLNNVGAIEYSKIVAHQLKHLKW